MENSEKSFNFVEVAFSIDLQKAQKKYKEELRLNVNNLKDDILSFEQWLTKKKYEALKFELENFGG